LSIYDSNGVFMITYMTYYFWFEVPLPTRCCKALLGVGGLCYIGCKPRGKLGRRTHLVTLHLHCVVDIMQDCHSIAVY